MASIVATDPETFASEDDEDERGGLTTEEVVSGAQLLQKCEAAVAVGLEHYVKLGQALKTIQDNELYKYVWNEDSTRRYATWSEYLRKRWDISPSYAHRNIRAYETASAIQSVVPNGKLPATEAVIRPLAMLTNVDAELTGSLWKELTTTNKRPTGSDVAKFVAKKRSDGKIPPQPKTERQKKHAKEKEDAAVAARAPSKHKLKKVEPDALVLWFEGPDSKAGCFVKPKGSNHWEQASKEDSEVAKRFRYARSPIASFDQGGVYEAIRKDGRLELV